MAAKVQKITFAESGLDKTDTVEREKVEAGMTFSITAVQIRNSKKFGKYATFDGADLEGNDLHLHTMSSVLTTTAEAMLEKYGSGDEAGTLTAEILVTVESRPSNDGRNYLVFA